MVSEDSRDGGCSVWFIGLDESHDPSDVHESFLLIFRRGRNGPPTDEIVTDVHLSTLGNG
jgi:hypothetical protein